MILADIGGRRHGLVDPPRSLPMSACEPDGIWNVAVSYGDTGSALNAAGGIAYDYVSARDAALGEAAERYAASIAELQSRTLAEIGSDAAIPLDQWSLFSDAQREAPGFPAERQYASDAPYVEATDAVDGHAWWVPQAMVTLDDQGVGVSTSTGLAAGQSRAMALLRGLQEVVERDALSITWLHGLPGRQVVPPAKFAGEVADRHGEFVCIDVTPEWSAHPVAIVAGLLPTAGAPRFSLGVACRATWAEALEKAYLEWIQGVVFAGVWVEEKDRQLSGPIEVTDFEKHAGYYTMFPERWSELPMFGSSSAIGGEAPPVGQSPGEPIDEFNQLLLGLTAAGVRVLYRDLTTPDVAQAGITVVRVMSPDLTPLHFDHNWPFLGGNTKDVRARYPWAETCSLAFPSPHPHPLG